MDEVLAFPDHENRYERVAGQVPVSPPPRLIHQIVLGELHRPVNGYVKKNLDGIRVDARLVVVCGPAESPRWAPGGAAVPFVIDPPALFAGLPTR